MSQPLLNFTEDIIRASLTGIADERELSIDDPVEQDVTTGDVHKKLQKTDPVNNSLLRFAAEHMFPSNRKQLALGSLKLSEEEYEGLLNENATSCQRNRHVIVPRDR